jgi:hypothetical protein
MNDRKVVDERLMSRIDTRLQTWRNLWVFFLVTYFLLGTASVALSALAASDILEPRSRQVLSLIAAVCVAVLGFLRPEARYRNLIRAWRELDLQKSKYLFGGPKTESLLHALGRTERLATEDEQAPDLASKTDDSGSGPELASG